MSALAPIGDKTLRGPFVRDVPKADLTNRRKLDLFQLAWRRDFECRCALLVNGLLHQA